MKFVYGALCQPGLGHDDGCVMVSPKLLVAKREANWLVGEGAAGMLNMIENARLWFI